MFVGELTLRMSIPRNADPWLDKSTLSGVRQACIRLVRDSQGSNSPDNAQVKSSVV